IVGVYATLGVFLLNASRNPQAHRSLIWFTVWSSVVHGGIMAAQSMPAAHSGHRVGDVPALFLVAIVLGGLLVWSGHGQATAGWPVPVPLNRCEPRYRPGSDVRLCAGFGRILLVREPASRDSVHVGEEEPTMSKAKTRTLGAVLYEDFELLDLFGPLEMFGSIG